MMLFLLLRKKWNSYNGNSIYCNGYRVVVRERERERVMDRGREREAPASTLLYKKTMCVRGRERERGLLVLCVLCVF